MVRRYRTLRDGAIADVGRASAMAAGGAALFAPIEYVLTVWAYSGPIAHPLRLAALTLTLALWLWLPLALATSGVLIGARLVRATYDADGARGPGWGIVAPPEGGVRRAVPVLWATLATGAIVALAIQLLAAWAILHFKEPQLTAGLIAFAAVGLLAVALPLRRVMLLAARVGADALAPVLGAASPLGRWRAAGAALAGVVLVAMCLTWLVLPQSRSVLPVRLVISGLVIAYGMGLGARHHARGPRPRLARRHALAAAGGALVLVVSTLLWWGADETKWVAVTASPAMSKLIASVRYANDLDHDGFGSLLGENDCAPLDASIHPGAKDLPDDGIDQNCDGHDFSLRDLAPPPGPTLPVPARFQHPWNILLITIDTLRYDHTTFGGYKRDTTPRLAELAKKSTSFTFCNAPSAGTMASIPAIITSKYFHDGLALDDKNILPGMPPRLKPENTLLMEIMKRGGYHTGVIASHPYWNDWGMNQGVDDYDNSIGKNEDPYIVAADKVTDHALAWISRNQDRKWFLWAHYIDPHGRYVAHPDVVDYGSAPMDLYDSEIKWTDQQIGRLLDQLQHMKSTPNTIIVITSDHGDSMGEHNVPVGTHGSALYFELQHVPMIFYIPDNQPHLIGGATTNLDIVPTLAELAGIDVHDLSFEGRSEVPAIFYGKEDHARVVFAETNYPSPERAAISEAYKLIFYMDSNLYEFFDLRHDPTEHHNLAPQNPPAMGVMKSKLDAWLERVVYSRNTDFNQETERMRDVLVHGTPQLQVATQGQSLDGGRITIDGIGVAEGDHIAPGAKVDVHVYFTVKQRTAIPFSFGLGAWPVDPATWHATDPAPPSMLRTPVRATLHGFFPSDRWRVGEHIRERFTLTIPVSWRGKAIAIAMSATGPHGEGSTPAGPTPPNEPHFAVLGALPMVSP